MVILLWRRSLNLTSWLTSYTIHRKSSRRNLSTEDPTPASFDKPQPDLMPGLAALESGELPKETVPRYGTIMDVVAEFQESQCYFIIATHTAAFVAIGRGDLFGATSFLQASANCNFILVMAEVSTVMNYLGVTICSIVGISSKWIQGLSILSLIFSIVALGLTIKKDGRCFYNTRVDRVPPVAACGGHSPPNVYCGFLSRAQIDHRPDKINDAIDFWAPSVLFTACLLFLIFLTILFHKKKPGSPIPHMQTPMSRWWSSFWDHSQLNWIRTVMRSLKRLWALFFIKPWKTLHVFMKAHIPVYRLFAKFKFRYLQEAALLFLCLLTLLLFYIVSELVKSGYIDFREWGIGQIIAVFVWVPVTTHWIRWQLSKSLPPFPLFSKVNVFLFSHADMFSLRWWYRLSSGMSKGAMGITAATYTFDGRSKLYFLIRGARSSYYSYEMKSWSLLLPTWS